MSERAAPVAAILLSRDNAVAATGRPWRWVAETARALGVPIRRVRRVAFVDAAAFAAAVLRAGEALAESATTTGDFVELDELRRRLGKRKKQT